MEPFDLDINVFPQGRGYHGKAEARTPAVTPVASPTTASPRSSEGKAARKFADAVDTMAFSPTAFAYILFTTRTALRGRVMSIVKAIILQYAVSYDNGDHSDDARTGRRLQDALMQFEEDAIAEENQWQESSH